MTIANENVGLAENQTDINGSESYNDSLAQSAHVWQQIYTGDQLCPFCGQEMRVHADLRKMSCANNDCIYCRSQAARNVVQHLLEAGSSIDVAAQIVSQYVSDTDDNAPFIIDTAARCEWALKKLAQWQQFINEQTACLESEITALKLRCEDNLDPIRKNRKAFESYFGYQIADFARAQMAILGRSSLSMLYGTIKKTRSQPKIEITDLDKFCAVMIKTGHEDLLRKKYEPQIVAIKVALDTLPKECRELITVIPGGENIKLTLAIPEPTR